MNTIQDSNNHAITVNTFLGNGLSCLIIEATRRFKFIKGDDEIMIFWDNHWKNEHSIRADWSLEKLMQWITKFYSEDFM